MVNWGLISGKIYDWADIVLALDDAAAEVVKQVNPKGDDLFSRLVFHDQSIFAGITIEHIKNTMKFRVIENHYSEPEARKIMQIQNLEAEIEGLEKTIWSWKFDFGETAPIESLEIELQQKKDALLSVIKTRIAS